MYIIIGLIDILICSWDMFGFYIRRPVGEKKLHHLLVRSGAKSVDLLDGLPRGLLGM